MAGLTGHWWIILIVLVVVLIIWGPGKLPDVGAGMGRAIREFRKASTETRDTIVNATNPAPMSSPAEPAQPSSPAQPSDAPSAGQTKTEAPSEQPKAPV